MNIIKMMNELIRYSMLISATVLFVIMGWFLYNTYDVYKDTRTFKVPLICHQNKAGTIELEGVVFLSEKKLKYFRGKPRVFISGKNLRKYLNRDAEVVFEMITENNSQKLIIPTSLIKKHLNNISIFDRIRIPIIYSKETENILYHRGANKIKITLQDYPIDNMSLSGEIILDAFGQRGAVLGPALCTILCLIFALILYYISNIFIVK